MIASPAAVIPKQVKDVPMSAANTAILAVDITSATATIKSGMPRITLISGRPFASVKTSLKKLAIAFTSRPPYILAFSIPYLSSIELYASPQSLSSNPCALLGKCTLSPPLGNMAVFLQTRSTPNPIQGSNAPDALPDHSSFSPRMKSYLAYFDTKIVARILVFASLVNFKLRDCLRGASFMDMRI
jgi:hypothetical protein